MGRKELVDQGADGPAWGMAVRQVQGCPGEKQECGHGEPDGLDSVRHDIRRERIRIYDAAGEVYGLRTYVRDCRIPEKQEIKVRCEHKP